MVTYRRKKMRGSSAVTSHIIQRGRSYSALPADEHFCFMAILTPIIMRKKAHFNTLVRHIEGDREETGDGVFLILHAVMGGFAVELQGPDIVSVVEKPGNEIVHGIDGIFLCVMAQDDTGVLIGEI